jgi:hypothetical protein
MLWLLAFGVIALLASGSGTNRNDTRQATPGNSVDAPFTPAELADLEEHRRRVRQADEDRCWSASAHEAARRVLMEARGRLSTARRLFASSFIVVSLISGVTFPYALREGVLRIWITSAGVMVIGLLSTWVCAVRVLAQNRDRAQCEVESSSLEWAAARQRFADVSKAADDAREAARERAARRLQRLTETQKKRAAEEHRAEALAAEVEKEQAAAAQAAEEEHRTFVAFVKEALCYAQNVASDPKRFVAVHGHALVAHRRRIHHAYVSGHVLGFTADECVELAERALHELPHEVAYWLPRATDRTVARLAHAFRAYSGAFREVMLPLALEQRAARATVMSTDSSVSAAKRPRHRKRSEVDRLLAAMPSDVAQRTLEGATNALTISAVGHFQQRVLDGKRAELQRRGVPEEVIQRQLEAMRLNLEKSASAFAEQQGLVSSELE